MKTKLSKKAKSNTGAVGDSAYEIHREDMRQRSAAQSRQERDIADRIKDARNVERYESCRKNFRLFCETYLPLTFYMPWSPDHLKAIFRIESAVLSGGLFAFAMPRGDGKSSLVEAACLWALLYGHRKFIALVGSSEEHAYMMLDSMKLELESNDLMNEDFWATCGPIRALEGIPHRCNGQLYHGVRTQIRWTEKTLILPTMPPDTGCESGGGTIKCAGITGRIRGMKFKRRDGETVRPDLVAVDDPQTDESSNSSSQVERRLSVMAGAILGLAGPGKKIAGFMPCTVIAPGDMADQILDRNKHPEWNGERFKMLYKFPANEKLWAEYRRVREDGLRSGDSGKSGNEFYQANETALNVGAEVGWKERFNHDEISAVQHAMNLFFRNEEAFWAEYQNQPRKKQVSAESIKREHVIEKQNGLAAGRVPVATEFLTAFIDIHQTIFFWVVVGWQKNFSGSVIDYGAFPEQNRRYFSLADARNTLAKLTPEADVQGAIFRGLELLTEKILGAKWVREGDGNEFTVQRCAIDARWGESTNTIYQFCRASKFSNILLPSFGQYVGAGSVPLADRKFLPGDQAGPDVRARRVSWIIRPTPNRAIRHLLFDTNHFKSFLRSRLAARTADPGSLTIFKGDHTLLADHLQAEYPVKTEGRGRILEEWKWKVERPDNHLLDCLVGATALASVGGADLQVSKDPIKPEPRRPRREAVVKW